MVRNIVFDIGNVLVDFRWREFLLEKGFDEAMMKRIGRASVETAIWFEFDRGEWSAEALMEAFIKNDPAIEKELHLAFDDLRGMIKQRSYAIPWIQDLRSRGYGVYYLSNFAGITYDQCRDQLSFLDYMDGGILSFREKLVKPDPRIYELLSSRYHLDPAECLFLDDTPANVEAALKLGWQSAVFTDQASAEKLIGEK